MVAVVKSSYKVDETQTGIIYSDLRLENCLTLLAAALSLLPLLWVETHPQIPFSSQLQLSPASYYKIIAKWSLNPTLVIHVS